MPGSLGVEAIIELMGICRTSPCPPVTTILRAHKKDDCLISFSEDGYSLNFEFHPKARHEAEHARVSIRNIRRDAISHIKDLMKEKEISEDDERRGEDQVQKITDAAIARVDETLQHKEKDLLEI